MKTLLTDRDATGQYRLRVEADDGLIEVADEFCPDDGRGVFHSFKSVSLTPAEAEFVRDAISELLLTRYRRAVASRSTLEGLVGVIHGIPPGAATRLRLYPSGTLFTPFDPRPEDIRIEDVAHGLACTNRFGGHLTEPYSVAQHCLIVCELCAEQPLWALLHEIAEALSGLGDVCGPTKLHPLIREQIKEIERGIEAAAAVAFGLSEGFAKAPCVKRADLLAYAWEDRDLRGGTDDDAWVAPLRAELPEARIIPMGWREAEAAFLSMFERLISRRRT